jgi:hypothetical protein
MGRPEVERTGSERIKFLEQFERCLDFARHDSEPDEYAKALKGKRHFKDEAV